MRCVNDEALPLSVLYPAREIAEALRIQGRDDGHQNGGDDHAGGNQRRCRGRNRFESRVNLGNDHRIRHGGPAAEEAATPAVPFPPPITRSAMISGMPVIMITATPGTIPSRPVSRITFRLMVFPSAKPKNGISTGVALLKKSRRSWSRFPSAKPIRKGRIADKVVWFKRGQPRRAQNQHRHQRTGLQRHQHKGARLLFVPYWFIRLA